MKKLISILLFSVSLNAFAYDVTSNTTQTGKNNTVTLTQSEQQQQLQLTGNNLTVDDTLTGIKGSNSNKAKICATLPGVDTPVCHEQISKITKYLQDNADKLDDIEIHIVSTDTADKQKRYIDEHKPHEKLTFLPDSSREFGKQTGTLIEELDLLARAIIVTDKAGVVQHIQCVPELTNLPDFEKAVDLAKAIEN
ncbi:MAG: redoxin family protein [Endozoicomonadaceae bacterium]|nr:redoxin family protein [Endozoicomonadaceae bacterium]